MQCVRPATKPMAEPAYLVFETGGTKLVAGVAGPDCRILRNNNPAP